MTLEPNLTSLQGRGSEVDDLSAVPENLNCGTVAAQPAREALLYARLVYLESTLPDNSHAPAPFLQLTNRPPVALPVAAELVEPELGPSCRESKEHATFVVVPEATVHEDDGPPARQDYIWPAWQLRAMEPVAEACMPQKFADLHFGARVLAPDP